MKTCKKCNIEKSLDEFYYHKGHRHNRSSHCKECIKKHWHKPEVKERRRLYRLNPEVKNRERNHHIRYKKNALESWEGYIPLETSCEVCGKKIFFNKKQPSSAINFDHKSNDCLIIGSPYDWLTRHPFNEENKQVWDSCKFGMLCKRCNSVIPTNDREKWLSKIDVYIRGANALSFPVVTY